MKDPRRVNQGNYKHPLVDILFLVISAAVSGADTWQSIVLFGKNQLHWLQKFFPYQDGIPSPDTLERVFAVLDFQEFSMYFTEWISEVCKLSEGEVIPIDGKSMRGSADKANGKKFIHMVSAFASENGVCLGQVVCKEKSNEITAIPELLELLAIKGCIVTIDAMGCQTKIATKIRSKKADYILAVKQNQDELYRQVNKLFSVTGASSVDVDDDFGHGRIERRKCTVINDLRFLDGKEKWKDISSVIKIESERYNKSSGKAQSETRLYISSLNKDAKVLNSKIRKHWAIENNLHWLLDVAFSEDDSRKRKGNSAKNFNLIAKVALNLIIKENTQKVSKKNKRFKAALDTEYREKILQV
jgi:predicted transposase YbfD/YdcC